MMFFKNVYMRYFCVGRIDAKSDRTLNTPVLLPLDRRFLRGIRYGGTLRYACCRIDLLPIGKSPTPLPGTLQLLCSLYIFKISRFYWSKEY